VRDICDINVVEWNIVGTSEKSLDLAEIVRILNTSDIGPSKLDGTWSRDLTGFRVF
jgi:hypothetical protein